jgi:hypothetical protein
MARAGSISERRLIFIVSSVFLVEGSLAAAHSFVERRLQRHARPRMMLHLRRSCPIDFATSRAVERTRFASGLMFVGTGRLNQVWPFSHLANFKSDIPR